MELTAEEWKKKQKEELAKEVRKKRQREWYRRNRERLLREAKERREADSEGHRERCREWRKERAAYRKEYQARWRKANPESVRETKRKGRKMKLEQDAKRFNGMYGLKAPETSDEAYRLLCNFKNILLEEVGEIEDVLEEFGWAGGVSLEGQVLLADWLGDIMIYCATTMARFGIPIEKTLTIIMESNFSKLGEDGKPIYDERGKVMKGPGYWRPEEKIRKMLIKEEGK